MGFTEKLANRGKHGYEAVKKSRDKGKFVSPYEEPKGQPRSIRLPLSLDEWVNKEMERTGHTRSQVLEEAILFFQQHQTA